MAVPVAIITADIHLSDKAPAARSNEPDHWFVVMERSLGKLGSLAEEYNVPVFYAGDIFDHWDASASLINFALDHLPKGYSIPGQHDLPYHSDTYTEKSAYQTLVKVGHLEELNNSPVPIYLGKGEFDPPAFDFYGFGWNQKIKEPQPAISDPDVTSIALVHRYLWKDEATAFNGADDKFKVGNLPKQLKGYDFAFFGDNHIPFMSRKDETRIINCGSLMRRNIGQKDYRPAVYLLMSDSTIKKKYIDTEDIITDSRPVKSTDSLSVDTKGIADAFRGLDQKEAFDIRNALETGIVNNPNLSKRSVQIIRTLLDRYTK